VQLNLCVLSAATVAQVTCATHGQSSRLAMSKVARSYWTCCLSVDQCSLVNGFWARAVAEVHAAGYRSPRLLTLTIVIEVHVASGHSLSCARTSTVREVMSLGFIERKAARDRTGNHLGYIVVEGARGKSKRRIRMSKMTLGTRSDSCALQTPTRVPLLDWYR